MPNKGRVHQNPQVIFIMGAIAAVLSLIILMLLPPFTNLLGSGTNMLSVHLLMEMFAIVIAILIVAVSWQTFEKSQTNFTKILICGF